MILKILKEKTTQLHKEVEKDNIGNAIVDHSITPEVYTKLLQQNYIAYGSLEKALSEYKNLVNDFESLINFSHTKKLRADLKTRAIGIPALSEEPLAFINSREACLGALYVVEGSTMGGLMMSRHLKKCEYLDQDKAHHFFHGDAKKGLKRWNTYKTLIDPLVFTEEQTNLIVKSACHTFNFFGKIYQSTPVLG